MTNLEKVETKNAPAAIGPYSQAIVAGNYMYLSGQLPVNPETGKIVEGEIAEQTEQVIANLIAVLAAKGLTLANVVKTEVYLKNLDDFAEMNKVYVDKFTNDPKPARQAMQVAKLPLDVKIEVSCVAYLK